MKKFQILVSMLAILVIGIVSLSAALPTPEADGCNEGNCLATYSCPYANRDYSKYMHSQKCETGDKIEQKCTPTSGTACCCLVLCEVTCNNPVIE